MCVYEELPLEFLTYSPRGNLAYEWVAEFIQCDDIERNLLIYEIKTYLNKNLNTSKS